MSLENTCRYTQDGYIAGEFFAFRIRRLLRVCEGNLRRCSMANVRTTCLHADNRAGPGDSRRTYRQFRHKSKV